MNDHVSTNIMFVNLIEVTWNNEIDTYILCTVLQFDACQCEVKA